MKENVVNIIVEEKIPVEEYLLEDKILEVEREFNESKLLVTKEKILNNSSFYNNMNLKDLGKFKDEVWVLQNYLDKQFVYYDFRMLKELKFCGIDDEDINIIKCWIAESLLEYMVESNDEGVNICRSALNHRAKYIALVSFLKETSNFSEEYLDERKGSKLEYYFENITSITSKNSTIIALKEYIEYIEDKKNEDYVLITNKYIKKICALNIENYSSNARQLPRASQILLFSAYIDKFFSDNTVSDKMKLYYKPLKIWWKITSVIPIRPSEFCIGFKRDCLIDDGENNYYIRINRIKQKINLKSKLLPVLNKLKITKELYNMINEYILMTKEDTTCKTLISYNTMLQLREELNEESGKRLFSNLNNKVDTNYFTTPILKTLIERFYKEIIEDKYNDKSIKEHIKAGDTRHIAFTSLMLQGYSPIEIAILGGHRTLHTLDNYTCSMNTYVDSEVINIITNTIKIESLGWSKVMDTFSNMSKRCPVSLEECIPAEIEGYEIGLCTIIKNKPNACYNDNCYECSNWWCEPSEYNYLKLEKILKKKLVEENNKLQNDLNFIKKLFSELGLEVVDGKLIVDHSVAQAIRRISLELQSNCKGVIELKYKLANKYDEKLQLISELESLLPMNEVNNYIEKNMIETQKKWEDKIIIKDE